MSHWPFDLYHYRSIHLDTTPALLTQVEDNLGALPIIAKLTPEVVARIDAVFGDEYE